jgi:hypothetical protein
MFLVATGTPHKRYVCRYVQAELVHARFAMLATAGIIIPGAILPGFPQWYEAGQKAIGGAPLS